MQKTDSKKMAALNLTALGTEVAPLWVDDPAGRGTWGLLYSCTFTLGICVWTSIHLNIPPKESRWKAWRRKLKWLFIALFAPELVVFTAFQQWLTAKIFLKELIQISEANASKDLECGVDSHQPKRKFDMTYAFYATMGGFVVDIGHLHNTLEQGTITTNGLLFLADHGFFPHLSLENIEDKSKANLLAKVLVCFQVIWVAGETIERKAAGYPISLLEFHTLVHIFCALVMYTLWFKKPYDVGNPTVITGIDEKLLGYLVASSRWSGTSGFLKTRRGNDGIEVFQGGMESVFEPPEDPKFHYYGACEQPQQAIPESGRNVTRTEGIQLNKMDDPRVKNYRTAVVEPPTSVDAKQKPRFPHGEFLDHYRIPNGIQTTLCLSPGQALRSGLGALQWTEPYYCYHVDLSDKDLKRLDLAGEFIDNNLVLEKGIVYLYASNLPFEGPSYSTNHPFDPFEVPDLNRHGRRLICHREHNILFSGVLYSILMHNRRGWEMCLLILAVILIPTAYGGIHLAALHEMFPRPIEFILWKASCFTLIGFAGFVVSVQILSLLGMSALIRWFEPDRESTSIGVARARKIALRGCSLVIVKYTFWLSYLALMLIVCAATFLYVGARVFIVVESFISLRHVPIGVYETPPTNFMSYVPHF
ncbi:hypothetical protein L207DRAFT_563960 [Hyaloscypha variabilis F]|uniref:Uncharacterized protein n=1 Tax=Hyaloscypha variabilis (strain UAMH 11265 / GT02V1 / F) TaxID=1149755 RepID=A0A2J6RXK3_HYAVF|nr:hypothetical protein L207DRAFT_563960 [Hyaloscypha variabilis F]